MSIGRDFVFHQDEMKKIKGIFNVILPSNFVD
jgi:hypothetical protein